MQSGDWTSIYQPVSFLGSENYTSNETRITITDIPFPAANYIFEVDAQFVQFTSLGTNYVFATSSTPTYRLGRTSSYPVNRLYWGAQTRDLTANGVIMDLDRHVYRLEPGVVYIDGVQKVITSSIISGALNSTFGLFANSVLNIHSLVAWKNGEKYIDFRPCYRKADNKTGSYEVVRDVFYTNTEGDTEFRIGDPI